MVDFRKMMLLLVVLAFTAGIASAQTVNPLQCVASAGVPPLARAEGLAEEIGQVTITCTGGNPTAVGAAIPTVNIQIYLSTNITSRLISGTASEAMLLIDEPLSAQSTAVAQYLCAAPGNCPMNAASSIGVGNYTGASAGRENVYQAVKAGENSLAWLGVPVDPPGTSGNRVLRMVNVRADAASVGVSSTLIPSNIIMYITISGTGALPLSNNTLNVAYVAKGMTFSATGGSYNQCEPDTYYYDLNFKENFGTAFRHNNILLDVDPNTAGTQTYQNQFMPGTIYNTESMWSSTGLLPAGNSAAGVAGVASQGTRLIARFSNVPANITLTAPGVNSGGTDVAWRVTSHDTNGAGGTAANTSGTVSLSGGAGIAVWEIMQSNPGNINTVTFTMSLSYSASPLPGLGTATVTGNYAPTSTLNTMQLISVAPAPRFVNDPQSATTFTINSCQTNLLFPYITNAAGFDTGISIANTTADPYDTPDQEGPCTLYFYGMTGAVDTNPPTQTSGTVPAGKSLIFTLSNGGGVQGASTATVNAAPDFTGYMIARCNFQYAHGYAFISDLGIRNWAQGYIALVLDQALGSRTGVDSEVLGN
ncbi:MAG TPA: hypothetical protein PLZ95_15185 [Bryobacteraceae bacterium]|nr:hypothetical protein [Bryobacteraceae bacterium]